MRITIGVLAVLFGLLHLVAAASQYRSSEPAARGSAVIMACGGIAVVCAAVVHLIGGSAIPYVDALSAGTGCLLVCFAAYLNGKRAGKLHPSHHIVRGAVSVLLVAGLLLW